MIPDVTMPSLPRGEKLEPKDLATKVQAMFMEVMIKAMEESVQAEEGLFGGSASSEIYRGMLREELAIAMARQIRGPLEGELNESLTRPEEADLPVDGVITSEVGWRQDPINGDHRYHSGIDIAAPEGTVVQAVAGGRVIESGAKGGYGNTVVIETDDGRKMLYAHNNQNFVRVGDRVNRGEAIAEVGSTGRATGPHVHFEVKF
ncbi:MAG: peptidoglycan DD-metalloendopeptidase family protein [Acidobacteria bacterium]|nr:peptidoglycan DD-metalloendopeptidase family protein [Acidobacteriota bacterium]